MLRSGRLQTSFWDGDDLDVLGVDQDLDGPGKEEDLDVPDKDED